MNNNTNITTAIAPIGTSKNGIEVFLHPESHSHRPDLNTEAISKITLPEGTFHRETVDMGRIIGKDHLVEIEPDSITFYWKRGNRSGASHMVLQDADDTKYVTVILCVCRKEEGTPSELIGKWILITLFEGCPGKQEPFDKEFENKAEDEKVAEAYRDSVNFWETHALVPTEKEMKEIKDYNGGWHFFTYEEGTPHENIHKTFKECISDYNTALQYLKEPWMDYVDEPSTIN